MLYLIGLGLHDEKDVTVRGLEIIRSCESVYLEAYTSILGIGTERLESFYGQKLVVADRELVESGSDSILQSAKTTDVAFLVVGDPLGATTHADLILRARELDISVSVVHNASVMNAIGATGIALYNYGQTISIPFFTDSWKPASFMEKINENRRIGLHTLCLLDIKVKEQSEENLARGRKIYEPPRFMSVPTALSQILSVLDSSNKSEDKTIDIDPNTTLAISISRLGAPDQKFVSGTMEQLANLDEETFGTHGLHCLVILGSRINPVEKDLAKIWAVDGGKVWEGVCKNVYGCL